MYIISYQYWVGIGNFTTGSIKSKLQSVINNPFYMHFRAYADSDYPPDATIAARQFAVCDFVLGTTTAVYAYVTTDGTDAKVSHLYIKDD